MTQNVFSSPQKVKTSKNDEIELLNVHSKITIRKINACHKTSKFESKCHPNWDKAIVFGLNQIA